MTTRFTFLTFIFQAIFLLCAASQVFAQTQPPADLKELKAEIKRIQQQTSVPAIGIALVNQQGNLWVDALGYKDHQGGTPAESNTLFRIGSISKMFTALGLMQLVDAGLISLDDPIKKWLPDLAYENPWESEHPIRIAHLLEHTTGWDVHTGEYAIEVDDSISLKEALKLHTAARVSRWVPGTRQSYSNTGPVVAARIIEEVTGKRFEAYMQQAVFTPMAMEHSSFLKNAGFDQLGASGFSASKPVEYEYIYSRPSSTMHASPEAMAKVLTMMLNRGQFNGQQIVSGSALKRMETPETTLGDLAGIHSGYGLGIAAMGFGSHNTPFYGHTGGVPGFAAEFIYQPELGLGYAFMINQDNPQAFRRLSDTLRAYLLKDQQTAPKENAAPLPKEFKGLDGFYTPINPLFDFGRAITDITDVLRIESSETYLHRSPFFGGWRSNDYLPEGKDPSILYSQWSGLPIITHVVDPISGPALQIEGKLYQKTSALIVYGRLAILLVSVLIILSSVIYGIFLLARWGIKRRKPKLAASFPILLSVLLLSIPLYLFVTQADIKLIFTSTALVATIYVFSLMYLVGPVFGWYVCLRKKRGNRKGGIYSKSVLMAHSALVIYFAIYGLLPLNLWA